MPNTSAPVVEIAFTSEFVKVLAAGPEIARHAGASPSTIEVLESVANIFAKADNDASITKLAAFKRDLDLVLFSDDTIETVWRKADLATNDAASSALEAAAEDLFELVSGNDLVDALRNLSVAFLEDRSNLVLSIVYEPPRVHELGKP